MIARSWQNFKLFNADFANMAVEYVRVTGSLSTNLTTGYNATVVDMLACQWAQQNINGINAWAAAIHVLEITPNRLPTGGGALVTITGTGFDDADPAHTSVTINDNPCTNLEFESAGTMTCLSPAGAGVNVTLVIQVRRHPCSQSVSARSCMN